MQKLTDRNPFTRYSVTFRAWTRDTGYPGHIATRLLRGAHVDGHVYVHYFGWTDFHVKHSEIIRIQLA